MNVDELPVEILMKIFNFLPYFDKVSLVNKVFYDVTCKLRDPIVCWRLISSLFTYEKHRELLQSIKNTTRKITNVNVAFSPTTAKPMMDTIKKFSATITYLKLEGELDLSDFLKLLSLVPNVKHLVFENVLLVEADNQPKQKKRRVMTNKKDLNLHYLKTLKFRCCSDEVVVVFNRLPVGVLTEFYLDNSNLSELNVLFKKQTNIKKLSVMKQFISDDEPVAVSTDIFDNQKLVSLEWLRQFDQRSMEIILSKQTHLKYLKLLDKHYDGVVGRDLMNVIVNNLTELETFSMCVTETPILAFKNITKLERLQNLTLRASSLTPFEEFAKLDNSRITFLDIQNMKNITVDLSTALANSLPNLKMLRFNCDENYKTCNTIMRTFNFIESLQLLNPFHTTFHSVPPADDYALLEGDCSNANLIELKIMYTWPCNIPFLKKLINDFPNLKTLIIEPSSPIVSKQFKLILDGFKKLESLWLISDSPKLTTRDLFYVRHHRNHLKFISLEGLVGIRWSSQIQKKLKEIFDIVKFEDYELKMAVGRKTMTREKMLHSYKTY